MYEEQEAYVFDFTIQDGPPDAHATVWSRLPLQGLSAGALTPFSGSVLCEIVGRAAYAYYEKLEFDPVPRAQTVRRHQGHTYLNLSALAKVEATQAGVAPPVLRINGELVPLADVEKHGLFSGFRIGRGRKKIDGLLDELGQHIDTTSRTASFWLQQIRDRQWTQADVLQVMEEIERTGVESMMAYLAARNNLDLLYNRLIVASLETAGFPGSLSLINSALSDIGTLVETGLAAALVELAGELVDGQAAKETLTQWLDRDSFSNWETTAPDRETAEGLSAFLSVYGHRAVDEAEMARPRWYEDPVPVMHGLLGVIERQAKTPSRAPSVHSVQELLAALDSEMVKAAPDMIARMRMLHHVQSHALHALAYVWAGTREWAMAAAHEATGDSRILEENDIFYFELEQIKQMMTGEWNVSDLDGIRATIEERKRDYAEWKDASAPPLLIDNRPAWSAQEGLPGGSGQITAPLRRLTDTHTEDCRDAILGTEHLDSGWALVLPVADGFAAAAGTPVDPCVAAARAWHRPTVIGLGSLYDELTEGAQTTLDGDTAQVEQ